MDTVGRQVVMSAEISAQLERLKDDVLEALDKRIDDLMVKSNAATDVERVAEYADHIREMRALRAKVLVSNLIHAAVTHMLSTKPKVDGLLEEIKKAPVSKGRPSGRAA